MSAWCLKLTDVYISIFIFSISYILFLPGCLNLRPFRFFIWFHLQHCTRISDHLEILSMHVLVHQIGIRNAQKVSGSSDDSEILSGYINSEMGVQSVYVCWTIFKTCLRMWCTKTRGGILDHFEITSKYINSEKWRTVVVSLCLLFTQINLDLQWLFASPLTAM